MARRQASSQRPRGSGRVRWSNLPTPSHRETTWNPIYPIRLARYNSPAAGQASRGSFACSSSYSAFLLISQLRRHGRTHRTPTTAAPLRHTSNLKRSKTSFTPEPIGSIPCATPSAQLAHRETSMRSAGVPYRAPVPVQAALRPGCAERSMLWRRQACGSRRTSSDHEPRSIQSRAVAPGGPVHGSV